MSKIKGWQLIYDVHYREEKDNFRAKQMVPLIVPEGANPVPIAEAKFKECEAEAVGILDDPVMTLTNPRLLFVTIDEAVPFKP